MALNWIPQTRNTCGQTCAAMLAGRPPEEVVALSGSRGGTTTRQIAALLRKLGFWCPDRLKRMKEAPPFISPYKTALLKIVTEGRKSGWHWVLYHDGLVYDPNPSLGGPLTIQEFHGALEVTCNRVSSLLPIRGGVAGD